MCAIWSDLLEKNLTSFGPYKGLLLITVCEMGDIILRCVQKGLNLHVYVRKKIWKTYVCAHS